MAWAVSYILGLLSLGLGRDRSTETVPLRPIKTRHAQMSEQTGRAGAQSSLLSSLPTSTDPVTLRRTLPCFPFAGELVKRKGYQKGHVTCSENIWVASACRQKLPENAQRLLTRSEA